MTLASLILPGETTRFKTSRSVYLGKSDYTAFVTNSRLILYAKRGFLGRDDFIGYRLSEIKNYRYHEEGLIAKKGILTLDLNNTAARIVGPAIDVKQLYNFIIGGSMQPTQVTQG
jgi:hypothetical protein